LTKERRRDRKLVGRFKFEDSSNEEGGDVLSGVLCKYTSYEERVQCTECTVLAHWDCAGKILNVYAQVGKPM
jgi:hypothetical protein